MRKIIDGLYVGTVDDIEIANRSENFSIIGACKDPLHRKHARISGATHEGYVGRAMPKSEPEYLYAERDHALYCNLIDAPEEKYIPDEIIQKCIKFINNEHNDDRNVLIVCNKAESRSPSIAFIWMISQGAFNAGDFDTAIGMFRDNFYPEYCPGKGMFDYTKKYWEMNKNARK